MNMMTYLIRLIDFPPLQCHTLVHPHMATHEGGGANNAVAGAARHTKQGSDGRQNCVLKHILKIKGM